VSETNEYRDKSYTSTRADQQAVKPWQHSQLLTSQQLDRGEEGGESKSRMTESPDDGSTMMISGLMSATLTAAEDIVGG
jgi:hypothetical protein